ncbi:MAG: energy-coupling factor transporter ATPase [Anaerolineae bacterium]|jgi:energy-coupling factor transport system ATP-binding protein|nr:energy-coupling factor transporter ATPase [Anaerolineae bacterium]
MTEPAIAIKGLTYRYRGTKKNAIEAIDLELEKGEFLVLMGPSEAGKSTLAACINGLIPHFHKGKLAGDVIVYGKNTREHTVSQMAEDVGLVFQDFEAQLFSTNVELEIAFGPENFAVPREEIAHRIDENLAYVGLSDFRNRPPSTLSGGQKQKLAIASVLALRPKVLVMDEPTTDLDPVSKMGIFEITDRLRRRSDLTLLVVEHETEEVLKANRIALLKDGQLVKVGPAREILQDIDLIESLGLMPLGIARFYRSLGFSDLPLTPDEAVAAYKEAGLTVVCAHHEALAAEEKRAAAAQAAKEPLIRCRDLEFTYPGGVTAIAGISLDVFPGDMVAIVGQNGSGKTTLAKQFNGLLLPTGGSITVNGKTTKEQGIFRLGQSVGYVFQNPDHQIFSETVFDEVSFGPRLRGLADDEVKARVAETLAAVGLEGTEAEDPFSMTKSGRQRVAVAAVLAVKPDVLILDEPTTGLDYHEQCSMMEMVKRLNKQGSTIIFITHHMWVVAEYARKVFVIKDGQLLLEGTPREVFAHEQELLEASLRPPHFIQFTNRLGYTMLRPEELIGCTEGGAG